MVKAVRASILRSNQDVYSMDKDLHNSGGIQEPTMEFSGKLRSLKGSKDLKLSWIYHCDGLMLSQIKKISRLVVWNPCTSQTRFIKPRICYRRDDTYTLGYNRSSSSFSGHSYKILRYYWYYKNDQAFAECEIYELSSDSWRVVLDSFPLDHNLCYNGISLKGDTYWIAQGKETGNFLMKFDFTTETFVRLPLPFQILDPEDKVPGPVSCKDEKLSVLHRYFLGGSIVMMKIWVSNNVCEEAKDLSWTSHFVLKVDFDKFHISSVMPVASFLFDEENKVAICCDNIHLVKLYEYKTRIYIVGDGMFKQVYNATVEPSRFTWPCVITYVPSLVHIQNCTPKTKREKKGRLALK